MDGSWFGGSITLLYFWSVFLSFDLYIDVEKLGVAVMVGGGGWVELDCSISSGHFLTMNFEFDQDQDPSLTVVHYSW